MHVAGISGAAAARHGQQPGPLRDAGSTSLVWAARRQTQQKEMWQCINNPSPGCS